MLLLWKKRRKAAAAMVCVGCIAMIAGFGGLMGAKYFDRPQEPVVLETVSDDLGTTGEEDQPEGADSKETAASGGDGTENASGEAKKSAGLDIAAKAAVLIDADTGTVVYQQDAHKELPPASVTKIMTMLLAIEAVDDGKLKLTDQVTISENAASMGGSQISRT